MKYQPIPQLITINGKEIGIKDLWNVKTDGSDCWIKAENNNFIVFDYDNRTKLLSLKSMEEAIEFIREIRSLPCFLEKNCNSTS